jgi:hypothetical protein
VHTYPFADLALARRLERAEASSNARFVELRNGIDPGRGACSLGKLKVKTRNSKSETQKPETQNAERLCKLSREGSLIAVASGMATNKPHDLGERTFQFACDVVRFSRKLSTEPGVVRQIAWQLADAGTSVAANDEEAKGSYSRREFAAKNAIV